MFNGRFNMRGKRKRPAVAFSVVATICLISYTLAHAKSARTLVDRDEWSAIGGHGYAWIDARHLFYLVDSGVDGNYAIMKYDLESHLSHPVAAFKVNSPGAAHPIRPNLVNSWLGGRYFDIHEWQPDYGNGNSDRERLVNSDAGVQRPVLFRSGLLLGDGEQTAYQFESDVTGSYITRIDPGTGATTAAKLPLTYTWGDTAAAAVTPVGLTTVQSIHGIDTVRYDIISVSRNGRVDEVRPDVLGVLRGQLRSRIDFSSYSPDAATVQIAPRTRKIAWLIAWEDARYSGWLGRLFEVFRPHRSESLFRIFLSDPLGLRFQEVGSVISVGDANAWRSGDVIGMRWTPDGKSLTYVEDGELKRIAVP